MIEGGLEVAIEGVSQVAGAGMVAIVPSGARHWIRALSDGRAIVVDHPRRREFENAG